MFIKQILLCFVCMGKVEKVNLKSVYTLMHDNMMMYIHDTSVAFLVIF